jgi:hypothetical protein
VIIALAIWVLYALGLVNNLPNMNHFFDKIGDSISNILHSSEPTPPKKW